MLADAQLNMRQNYINGGPGVIISGLVYTVSAGIVAFVGFTPGMWTLFIGGVAIYPLSTLWSYLVRGKTPTPDKGLTQLTLLTLPILFGGILLALYLSRSDEALLFPVMAATIGLRYLIFQCIYGLNAYLLLGGLLIAVSAAGFLAPVPLVAVPIAIAVIELAFGVFLLSNRKTLVA
jgi:hypothetical protein